ncbi:hypothetical protein ACHRV5_03385 [Flavobacterium sp. FlaQc-52]|jgi:hypothetical protein|uniref:hypothetical protein n=1 Tax=Flavobacterium sp. FlaQc-52 TaxID=3374185 RepID=UPI0037563AA3
MKFFYLTLLCMFLSCSKNENISKELPTQNFCGYGVIKFSKSYSGSIRYMEFYPISKTQHPDSILANKLKISIKNGLIIRGDNSTKLWQDLIQTNNLNPDEYGYYKSLIFLDLSNNTLEYDYKNPISNEVLIQKEIFQTKTFDYIKGELVISNYKILHSL